MSIACETTELAQDQLIGALHPADLTARPQIVDIDSNEEYYKLIDSFYEITGVGALLNTSLNLHGSPIARTAKESIEVLKNSDLDGMLLDTTLVLKD